MTDTEASAAPAARGPLSPGSPLRRWGPWVLVAAVVVSVLSIGAFGTRSAPTAQDRVNSIARSVRCPTCNGESVAESNAPASQEIRIDIGQRVQEGQTDAQIRDYYASKYGRQILLSPPTTGVSALVWVLPVVAFAVAVAGLVIVFRRWQTTPAMHASEADRALVEQALHGEAAHDHDDDPHGEGASR